MRAFCAVSSMPIRQFLGRDTSLGPDDLKAMGEAFDAARAKLGLLDLKDPLTEIVARRIVQAALRGERDPIKLCEIGVDDGDQAVSA
jgi:hypothetical protein